MAVWAIASPLLLLLVTNEWLFTPEGFLDPWTYVGLFLNYQEPGFYPQEYKLARLPWILAGWVAHHVAPEPVAAFALHAGFLLLATAGVWFVLFELFRSASTASIGAVLLGFSTYVHGSGGWDYHNAGAGAFYIWTVYAVTYAARVATRRTLFVAGSLAAAALHSNIILVNFVPLLAAHFVVLRQERRGGTGWQSDAARAALWTALGAAAVTAALIVVNGAVRRQPLFFRPIVDVIMQHLAGAQDPPGFFWPTAEWLLKAQHLSLPFATALASGCLLLMLRRTPRAKVHVLLCAEFVALAALWTMWQAIGQPSINIDYFVYPILPHAVLAAAAMIDLRAREAPWWIAAAAPLVLAAPLALAFHQSFARVAPGLHALGAAVPAAILFLAAFACCLLPRSAAVVAFLVLFGLGNASAAFRWERYAAGNTCRTGRAINDAVIDLNRFVASFDPDFRRTSLWFARGETLQLGPGCTLSVQFLGYALQSSGVANIADNPYPMPSVDAISAARLQRIADIKHRVAVLGADPAAWRAIDRRAASLGLALRPVAERKEPFGHREVTLTLADVVPR